MLIIKYFKLTPREGAAIKDKRLKKLERTRSDYTEVRQGLKPSLKWTGGTIFACFALIPATPLIMKLSDFAGPSILGWGLYALSWTFLIATIAAASGCLWHYYPLILNVIN